MHSHRGGARAWEITHRPTHTEGSGPSLGGVNFCPKRILHEKCTWPQGWETEGCVNLMPDLMRSHTMSSSGCGFLFLCLSFAARTHTHWLSLRSVSSNVTNSQSAWLVKGDRSWPIHPSIPSWAALGQSGCSLKKTAMRPCMFHVHLSTCRAHRLTGQTEPAIGRSAYCISAFYSIGFWILLYFSVDIHSCSRIVCLLPWVVTHKGRTKLFNLISVFFFFLWVALRHDLLHPLDPSQKWLNIWAWALAIS